MLTQRPVSDRNQGARRQFPFFANLKSHVLLQPLANQRYQLHAHELKIPGLATVELELVNLDAKKS
jgi:hypothetical protein